MTIKTIIDLDDAEIIKFASISPGDDEEPGSAFTKTMTFRKVIKKINKLSNFLEKNGFVYTYTSSPEYGLVGGLWENLVTGAAFSIEIRYGDHIVVRETEGFGAAEDA